MYQNTQQNQARPFQVPPPPPMSPPVAGQPGQLNTMLNIPPPPPRYPGAPTTTGGVVLPPPPGPPPNSALGPQPPWQASWGRTYSGQPSFTIPPPPAGGPVPSYNPKLHSQASNGALSIPPPPPVDLCRTRIDLEMTPTKRWYLQRIFQVVIHMERVLEYLVSSRMTWERNRRPPKARGPQPARRAAQIP